MNPERNNIFDNLAHMSATDESDVITLIPGDEEKETPSKDVPAQLPILPLRNTVLYPGVILPITAGRDKSIRLLQKVYAGNRILGVVTQLDADIDDPHPNDLHAVGTMARIVRMFRMPDGNTTVILQGQHRIRIDEMVEEKPFFIAKVTALPDKRRKRETPQFKAMVDSIRDLASQIIRDSPNIPNEAVFAIRSIESPSFLTNFIANHLNMELAEKQQFLEETDLTKRAHYILKHLTEEQQMLEMKNEIQSKVKTEFDQQQREYFLHQQMKTIQEELGGSSSEQEIEEMRGRAAKKKWTAEVGKIFEKELAKLQRTNPQAPEFGIQRNYLELFLDLPWNEYSKDRFDLVKARKILDRDHLGLEKVKERVLEHLAVLKLKGDMKAPILCLYGPPGVGKTSLGKSIAESLGRKYIRMSLGGMRDEAEIRGHRKTYIGAMPGRILQLIKKAGTANPVFVLDEIDKLAHNGHGDPSSAMLEVLDPEQNNDFHDHFLETGFDLSKVLFIATANNLGSIQPALRDRMEIIEINGYTQDEKLDIAEKHLMHRQLVEHGLKKGDLKLKKADLAWIIEGYTRESGVRGLDKVLAKLVRNRAMDVAQENGEDSTFTRTRIQKILGAPRFERERYQGNDVAGVVTGLAWTPVGGEILFIESSLHKGSGKMAITGNLGDVMKESASIALAWLKAHAQGYGIPMEAFKNWDLHIHVPEGATPKDGPSAGVTMLTALTSLYTQRKVKSNLAMTGEITLRGKVLPVGGIKEKILAAKRAGMQEIILCADNQKDVNEIEDRYLKGLTFHYVKNMDEVLELALLHEQVKQPLALVENQ